MSNTFTVFGLQRSGTNFLEQLLKNNVSQVNIVNRWKSGDGIWKHAYDMEKKPTNGKTAGEQGDKTKAEMIGGRIHAIYIHKHPYSWLQSITNKHVDIKKTYPFVTDDSTIMLKDLNLIRLTQLYRDHTAYWLNKVETRKVYHVKYEDLIESESHTKEIVKDIASFFDRKIKHKTIQIPNRVSQSKQFTEEERQRYKKYQIQTLSYEHIQEINRILNRDHLEKQGYDLIETERDYRAHKV